MKIMKNPFKRKTKREVKLPAAREAVIPDWMDDAFHKWEKENSKSK